MRIFQGKYLVISLIFHSVVISSFLFFQRSSEKAETFMLVTEIIKIEEKSRFNDVKKWVTQNLDSDPTSIMRKIYDNLSNVMEGPSIAAAVLIIAEYQYKSAFVVDQEINLLACLTQLMIECNFK